MVEGRVKSRYQTPWIWAKKAVVVTCTNNNIAQVRESVEDSSMGTTVVVSMQPLQCAIRRMVNRVICELVNFSPLHETPIEDGFLLMPAGVTTPAIST